MTLIRLKFDFNPHIVIDNHSFDGNHINGIIYLTNKGIGVIQFFLQWALWARLIDYYKNEQKIFAAKKLHLSANFVKIFIPNLFKNWVIFSEDSLTRHLSAKIDHFL